MKAPLSPALAVNGMKGGLSACTKAAPLTYSVEEIIAEMAAAYLCGITGIENRTIDNSAAYIAGWLKKKLRGDRKLIVHAAAQAQRACDYVLNVKVGE